MGIDIRKNMEFVAVAMALVWCSGISCTVELPEGKIICDPINGDSDCPNGWICKAADRFCYKPKQVGTAGEGVAANTGQAGGSAVQSDGGCVPVDCTGRCGPTLGCVDTFDCGPCETGFLCSTAGKCVAKNTSANDDCAGQADGTACNGVATGCYEQDVCEGGTCKDKGYRTGVCKDQNGSTGEGPCTDPNQCVNGVCKSQPKIDGTECLRSDSSKAPDCYVYTCKSGVCGNLLPIAAEKKQRCTYKDSNYQTCNGYCDGYGKCKIGSTTCPTQSQGGSGGGGGGGSGGSGGRGGRGGSGSTK
jgi:hypothetical protein